MKFVTIAVLLCVGSVTMAAPADQPRLLYDLEQAPQLFEKFVSDFNRVYKDDDDKQAHYTAFVQSLRTINESNEKNPTATYGINKFADYTPEERKSMFGFKKN